MAVLTPVSHKQAAAFLEGYDIGLLEQLIPIEEGVENTNYKLISQKGSYVLTLFEGRTPATALPFIFKLLKHLTSKNIPIARPVANNEGNIINPLNGKFAAIVGFIEGQVITRANPKHCETVGAALAKMHLATLSFIPTRDNSIGIRSFTSFAQKIGNKFDQFEQGLATHIMAEIDFLKTQKLSGLPKGVIHADLFMDNVLFQETDPPDDMKISGFIDFYYAANDHFAYDMAIAMNDWCWGDEQSLCPEKTTAFIRGYETVRPLLDGEKQAMNVFFRAAALRFLLSRAFDWFLPTENLIIAKKNPLEYVKKLKFHQNIQNYIEYGLL